MSPRVGSICKVFVLTLRRQAFCRGSPRREHYARGFWFDATKSSIGDYSAAGHPAGNRRECHGSCKQKGFAGS